MNRLTGVATILGIVLLFVGIYTLTPYLTYAQQGNMHRGDQMQQHRAEYAQSRSGGMHDRGGGMMGMPMMHSNMSEEQMDRMCDRMRQRHESMMEMRKKQSEKLNSLVESMKSAEGDEKIEAMEKTLVELIDQHNQHQKMRMGSMHGMMRSMMNMHQMDSDQRQMMMNRMQDCPMMSGDTGSSTE